jgi:hypothetical protein
VKFLMTIDTEEAWDWGGPYPRTGYSVEHISRLPQFQSVCDAYKIRSTYFVNHAVASDSQAAGVIFGLSKNPRVEIGMHVHPWTTPPMERDGPVSSRETYLHNTPPDIIKAKLESVYQSLVTLGVRPTSFRGGRYSSGGEIHQFLRRRGFIADCSVVPYTRWKEDGAPDFRRRDVFPLRVPSSAPDSPPLWEIPLSLGFSRRPFGLWAPVFRLIEETPLRRLRLIGIAERLGVVRRVWLNFEIGDRTDWKPFLKLLQCMGVPCVTITVHSSSLFAGPGPYTRDETSERRIFDQIDAVFRTLSSLDGFEPATASEAATYLESMHASSGY